MAARLVIVEEETKRLHTLSEQEYEVLGWFAHGLSCTDIAARLVLSPKPVASYRGRLLDNPPDQNDRSDPLCLYEQGQRACPDSDAVDTAPSDRGACRESDDAGSYADCLQIT